MTEPRLSDDYVAWVKSVRMSRRASLARDVLLTRGSVTTAELNSMGYDHPPRIIRDLKDAGVTVLSSSVTVDGRRMARYTLVDTVSGDVSVRKPLPRDFRKAVYDAANGRCAACNAFFEFRYMQTDHRVPFAVAGDPDPLVADSFMTLCGADNRAKSWSCEHCENWTRRDPEFCQGCYWVDPRDYRHIAGIPEARLVFVYRYEAAALAREFEAAARRLNTSVEEAVLGYVREFLTRAQEGE